MNARLTRVFSHLQYRNISPKRYIKGLSSPLRKNSVKYQKILYHDQQSDSLISYDVILYLVWIIFVSSDQATPLAKFKDSAVIETMTMNLLALLRIQL